MDFDETYMREHGHGQYERLGRTEDTASLHEELYKEPLRESVGSWDEPDAASLSPVEKYKHLLNTPVRGADGAGKAAVYDSPVQLALPPSFELPPLWLGYLANPSDSGKIHKNVKQLWLDGDVEVRSGMKVRAV
jgi:hypothetical protein